MEYGRTETNTEDEGAQDENPHAIKWQERGKCRSGASLSSKNCAAELVRRLVGGRSRLAAGDGWWSLLLAALCDAGIEVHSHHIAVQSQQPVHVFSSFSSSSSCSPPESAVCRSSGGAPGA